MKKIIPLFLLALVPLAASAAWEYDCIFNFKTTDLIRYSYTAAADGTIIGEPLVQNEIIRVVLVRDATSTTSDEIPFKIDIAGQLVPAEGVDASQMAWMQLNWLCPDPEKAIVDETTGEVTKIWVDFTDDMLPVGETQGMPCGDGGSDDDDEYTFNVGYPETFPALTGSGDFYAYLVALDTRDHGKCIGAPVRVARYAVTKVPKKITTKPVIGAAHKFSFKASDSGTASVPGLALTETEDGTIVTDTWVAAAPITSLTVEIDGTQQTLTRAELEDYLSPEIASATFVELAAGASLTSTTEAVKTLQIQASSTDLVCYTLYTATSLTGEWTTFDALRAEKDVDTVVKKEYTRFRIDGESKTITIPVYDDATRFYQLRMDN